jgi:molybdate transport system substrate-binding protein
MFRVLSLLAVLGCSSHSGRTVRIAAASDLARAFDELGKLYESKTGIRPVFDFGSSGLFAKQISGGAPYALFAAANRGFAEQAAASGHCDPKSIASYARGRLVVWTPGGVTPPKTLAELADPRFEKIAIANPEHAPYGVAAKQALEKIGVWSAVEPRIVLGENVQATMQYAKTGAVQASVVALSLAVVTEGGASLPVDPALHEPLDQALVVCGSGDDAAAARKFAELVGSREGREVMNRYGFQLPGEDSPKPRR